MIVVSGTITVDAPDVPRALELFRAVAAASRRELGCHAYAVSTDVEVPGKFRVFEEWASRAPLMAHLAAPHIQQFMAAIGEIRVLEVTVVHYEATGRKQAV